MLTVDYEANSVDLVCELPVPISAGTLKKNPPKYKSRVIKHLHRRASAVVKFIDRIIETRNFYVIECSNVNVSQCVLMLELKIRGSDW